MGVTRAGKPTRLRGSISGSLLGLLVFLAGVALLAFTFKLAYEMFMMPPQDALGVVKDKPIDLGLAGQSFVGVLIKILMLVVMGLVGSMIANRGVTLFAGSRVPPGKAKRESANQPETDEARSEA